MRIFDPKLTGSIEFLNPVRGGFTGSIFGSSSYALTASYALNGGGGGGTPGGSNTQIQYNNGGSFGGVSTATFDGTTLRATGSFSGSLTGIASTASFVSLGAVNQNVIITGSVTISGSAVPELFVLGDSQFTGSLRVLGNVSATSLTGSITASSLQGAILNSQLQNSSVTVGTTAIALGSSATTIAGITSLTSTNITASIISASNFISGGQIIARNGFTGSITASSLQGDIILGTQTSGQYASTIAGGAGLTATTANATDGTAYTIDAVAGAGISLTAPTNDAINIDTGSAHFTGGVTNRLNSSNVLSGSVSSPSQGTISVGGFTNIDLGLQTNDNVTFNNITSTGNVVIQGNLTAQQFIVSSSVYFTTTSFSSGSTIFGNDLGDTHQFTGSLRVLGSITGSISASNLVGAITNAQLQNSSVTVGSTAISLGSSATTVTGLISVNSTSITASIVSASQFTGSLFGTASFSNRATTASFYELVTGSAGNNFNIIASLSGSIINIPDASTTARGLVTTGTQNLLGAKNFNGIFAVGASFTNGNLLVVSPSSNDASTNNVPLQLFGSSTVHYRLGTAGATNAAIGNGFPYATHIIGAVPITEGSSGTHPLISQLAIRQLNVTNGTATTDTYAGLYIEGAISGSATPTNNYALWVDSGSTRLDGDLIMSQSNIIVTGSVNASAGFTGSLFGTASYVRNLYISASETANASPTPNELWYDASTGKTYIRYRSGSNEAWVLQSDPTIDVTTSLQTLQEVTDLGSTTTNVVAITNTTNAIDSASGALIVSGGAGFRLDVWARKFYGDGSGLTGVSATYTETDTLQTVTTRGNETSASVFVTNTTNATSKTIGALRVSGGLAVEQDIFAERVRATSFTGSLFGTASFSTTASYALNAAAASSFPFTGSAIISGSLTVTGSVNVDRGVTGSLLGTASYARQALTASNANTASFALTASFLLGGGSQVNIEDDGSSQGSAGTLNFVGTSVTATVGGGVATITVTGGSGTSDFPYTGSAIISGSLIVTGSARILADGNDGFESFGNVNDYFEIFAQNRNNGISASSDIVAYNDQGNKTQNYVDMGINSSGISPTYSFGRANDAYVYNTGGDLFIGNSTAFYQPTRTSQSLHLFSNAPGRPDLTITGSRIGIQKSSSLNATLDVLGNVIISGALHISGSALAELKVLGDSEFTGSVRVTNGIIAQSVTASLQGSASYAITASYALNGGGGGGNSFETIAVAGQSDVVAESSTDTLTLVAGSGMTITTDAGTDTITFASPAPNIFSRGITISDPTNAEDATIMFTTASLTINRLAAVIRGTANPSVTFTLRYAATRSLTGTEVITGGTIVNTTGSALISSSGFTNATVPVSNFVWLETTATAGTVNELFVQFYY